MGRALRFHGSDEKKNGIRGRPKRRRPHESLGLAHKLGYLGRLTLLLFVWLRMGSQGTSGCRVADLCVGVGSIGAHFESRTDPRYERNRKHLLVDIVVISICGILCGASGPTAIHRWAKSKHEWLAKHFALPYGIPSRGCLRRLLMFLKPEAFQKCFKEWIANGVEAEINPVAL